VSAAGMGVPAGGLVPEGERTEILAGVLARIELGAWDQRIAEWLAGWDTATVVIIASWIERSREAW
jgi:hypothetical protein